MIVYRGIGKQTHDVCRTELCIATNKNLLVALFSLYLMSIYDHVNNEQEIKDTA